MLMADAPFLSTFQIDWASPPTPAPHSPPLSAQETRLVYKTRTRPRRRSIDRSGWVACGGVLCLSAGQGSCVTCTTALCMARGEYCRSSGISYEFFTLHRRGKRDPDACLRRTFVFLSCSNQID